MDSYWYWPAEFKQDLFLYDLCSEGTPGVGETVTFSVLSGSFKNKNKQGSLAFLLNSSRFKKMKPGCLGQKPNPWVKCDSSCVHTYYLERLTITLVYVDSFNSLNNSNR